MMDILIYQKEFQGKPTNKFTYCTLNQRLALAGLLSLSAFSFQNQVYAADIGSQDANIITLNDGDKITADRILQGVSRYGVSNEMGNTANINLANDVSITAVDSARHAVGIYLGGDNSVLKANRLSVDVIGLGASGISLKGTDSQTNLGSGSSIRVENLNNTQGVGIELAYGATLKADNLSIITKGDSINGLNVQSDKTSADLGSNSIISTNGTNSRGIYIFGNSSGPSSLKATLLTIKTEGYNGYGLELQNYSIADLGSGTRIDTFGQNGIGVLNYGKITADGLTVKTEGAGASAFQSLGSGSATIGADSHMFSKQAGGIVTSGNGATINYLGTEDKRNTIFSGGSYGASAQSAGAKINLAYTDINVDRDGEIARGLWVLRGGYITADHVVIHGADAVTGVYAMTDSQIDLTGDTTIHMATSEGVAITTQHNDGYAASRINASGKMDIIGGILSRGGLIDIKMASGSQWIGQGDSDQINGGFLNIAMTDSHWSMAADSRVDKLVLNNSTVEFSEDKVGSLLTVGDLSGNGSFILRTDLVGDGVDGYSDKLIVTGSSAGDHKLTVLNRGSLATTGNEILTVVETQDGVATFTSSSQVELGGYLYDVRQNGTHWELYSSGVYVPPSKPDPETELPSKPDPKPPLTTSADAGANFLNIGYLMNYAETQTLLQRMGDLRQNGESGNMWLRGFAGKFDSFSGGKLSHFDMKYSGVQFGADKRVSTELPLFTGIFIGQTHGSPNYRTGGGSTKSDSVGLYATYMANNGFYLDGMAKYSHIKNSFNVRDSQDNRVNGNGNSDGFSASLESGQKFSLNQLGNGFYIEPQAQLSFSHQGTNNIVASNGLKIDLGSYKSIIGRASAVVGYELPQGNHSLNIYLKTGYLREFSGDTDYQLNGSPESHSFKGGWWNNGVGVSAQMNKQHALYLDLDTSTGNKFNQRQMNGGYRFSF
ncbi:P.93 [Pragia fontium]|uniref:autotransporter outer membrane beta-barrel domain-containing protein n=1 Tax=Pragia fontium TaxID=82985 RepID=UPI000F6E7B09|nr:autotransporter outer membrane beta-barrel domain-containing protein [Pragia fontium]VEJ55613.1 P.93 [Pragia fontium]